ncbi:hypothetical protein LIER_42132 [Lithospermum erythrorhizon]|uniref:Uncharacterized protein n=1 Tax=Lithospermum erythrorhizon TaxID=34254 RepID=A0AAV3RQX4_LITER
MEENFSSIFVPHNSSKFKSTDSIPSWCVQSRGHRFGVGQAIGEDTKHVELDNHFVREKVALGQVNVHHVPYTYQIVDFFSNGLPLVLFQDFQDSLSV